MGEGQKNDQQQPAPAQQPVERERESTTTTQVHPATGTTRVDETRRETERPAEQK